MLNAVTFYCKSVKLNSAVCDCMLVNTFYDVGILIKLRL